MRHSHPFVHPFTSNKINERHANIGITVDLLTNGIDVPKICDLVFMRRLKSRIFYEQVIGRATRRCDDIGKTVFRIYDTVDIYASLQQVNVVQYKGFSILDTCGQLGGLRLVMSPNGHIMARKFRKS